MLAPPPISVRADIPTALPALCGAMLLAAIGCLRLALAVGSFEPVVFALAAVGAYAERVQLRECDVGGANGSPLPSWCWCCGGRRRLGPPRSCSPGARHPAGAGPCHASVLDKRTLKVMAGAPPLQGFWHLAYVALEVDKVALLAALGAATALLTPGTPAADFRCSAAR